LAVPGAHKIVEIEERVPDLGKLKGQLGKQNPTFVMRYKHHLSSYQIDCTRSQEPSSPREDSGLSALNIEFEDMNMPHAARSGEGIQGSKGYSFIDHELCPVRIVSAAISGPREQRARVVHLGIRVKDSLSNVVSKCQTISGRRWGCGRKLVEFPIRSAEGLE
jgi:hypothetical protein